MPLQGSGLGLQGYSFAVGGLPPFQPAPIATTPDQDIDGLFVSATYDAATNTFTPVIAKGTRTFPANAVIWRDFLDVSALGYDQEVDTLEVVLETVSEPSQKQTSPTILIAATNGGVISGLPFGAAGPIYRTTGSGLGISTNAAQVIGQLFVGAGWTPGTIGKTLIRYSMNQPSGGFTRFMSGLYTPADVGLQSAGFNGNGSGDLTDLSLVFMQLGGTVDAVNISTSLRVWYRVIKFGNFPS